MLREALPLTRYWQNWGTSTKFSIRLIKQSWFKQFGWIYLPIHAAGIFVSFHSQKFSSSACFCSFGRISCGRNRRQAHAKAGEWTSEDNEGFRVTQEDHTSIAIKHWAKDALWFDIPPFASRGIPPAIKMFDRNCF